MKLKIAGALLIILGCTQCSQLPTEEIGNTHTLPLPQRTVPGVEPIDAIASELELPPAVVALGRQLFHDGELSGSRRISCATCHPTDSVGTTNEVEVKTYYDIPTIFNSGNHFAYFWNGRAQSLKSVIQISVQAENILDSSWKVILPRLIADEGYKDSFDAAYPGIGLTEDTVVDALVVYTQSLVTPNAAFDRWLNGESLTESAREGYQLFTDYGCIRCHQGVGIGGNMYASFRNFLEKREPVGTTDFGRFNVTNDEAHRFEFKVPSLRNVAVTPPYFHDGSAATLYDAVDTMAQYQLGQQLTRNDINKIVSFLESLTGRLDGVFLGGDQ